MSDKHGTVRRRIVVVGSANMDMVMAVDRLPREGETITGHDFQLFPGGKGANQACASGRLGGAISLIGQVGDDAFGATLLASLSASGVNVEGVGRSECATGCASIYVMPGGKNSIVISPGANATLGAEMAVTRLRLAAGDLVLCQLETPLDTVAAILAHAKAAGAITMLDPAPAHRLPEAVLRTVDLLTPNQTEAAVLLEQPNLTIETFPQAQEAANKLRLLGASAVVMKLGERGALYRDAQGVVESRAFRVKAVDTTAAGDTFNGALAVALAEGQTMADALQFANAAAALSVTRAGAQPSMPTRQATDDFLAGIGKG